MSYAERYAQLYDLFYADKPYDAETQVIVELLHGQGLGPGARLLDVACGTGKHAVRLARAGYEITAVDASADMIAMAEARAGADHVALVSEVRDMRSLGFDNEFDAVTCLFDSIGYGETNEGIAQTLASVRDSLRPGGVFIVEFWHAAAMLRGYDPVRVRRWPLEDGEVIRISETRLDAAAQVAEVSYTVFERGPGDRLHVTNETHRNRYFGVQEMALLLDGSGLAPLAWHDGFGDGPVSEETWHVVAVARRA